MAGGADGLVRREISAIPEEVIRATIRNNQKCFVLRDAAHAKLANKFLLVSNIEAERRRQGHRRRQRARHPRAAVGCQVFLRNGFQDQLEDRLPKFKDIVFHEKLGTQAERIERIERLAGESGADRRRRCGQGQARGAAVQGRSADGSGRRIPRTARLDGKYYAEAQGEDEAVAHACEDHYKPKGPDDLVPSDPVSVAVALADKIDTLVGFWAIDEKPTGSKDPYALRRAALGVIRLILTIICGCSTWGHLIYCALAEFR